MKPKGTTLSKRFGFQDPDLTTPQHDEIILALLDRKRMFKVLRETVYKDLKLKRWFIEECRRSNYGHGDKPDWLECGPLREKARDKYMAHIRAEGLDADFEENRSEKHCIMNKAGWGSRCSECPMGDTLCSDTDEVNALSVEDLFTSECLDIKTEYVVKNDYNSFVIGFIDLQVIPSCLTHRNQFWAARVTTPEKKSNRYSNIPSTYIEVKTKITSFGETMRQINMYREFVQGYFLLVTTSTGFKDAFESQGVHVYEWI